MFGEAALEQIVVTLGYIGIFGLMTANGVFSFPSSQILYIIGGYFVYTGSLDLSFVVLAGTLGNTLGNYILFRLSAKYGLPYITKLTLLPETEIRKVQVAFEKRGTWFLFAGKLLPAIKVFVPIVAGIAKMRTRTYLPIIFVSSALWSLIFIGIGYFFGKQADFFGKYVIVLFIIALVLVGVFYRYMNSAGVLKELGAKNQ